MLALFSPGTPRTMTLKAAVGFACAFARRVEGTKAPLRFAASADPVDAEDRDRRVIDQRRREEPGRLAGARDGERAVAQLLERELSRVSRLGQASDLRLELVDRLRVDVAHDGDDEALVRLDGDADVAAVEIEEVVALDPRIQLGKLAERAGHGPQGQGEESLHVDVGEVALLDPGDRRDLSVR